MKCCGGTTECFLQVWDITRYAEWVIAQNTQELIQMRGWCQNHSCRLLILMLIWNQVWLLVKEGSSATLQETVTCASRKWDVKFKSLMFPFLAVTKSRLLRTPYSVIPLHVACYIRATKHLNDNLKKKKVSYTIFSMNSYDKSCHNSKQCEHCSVLQMLSRTASEG